MAPNDTSLPLVSVGIPTYNRPEGLRRTLECITNQTYKNLEIIISDNCSPDPRVEWVAKDFEQLDSRIRYYRQAENKGPEFNFKFVLEQASGEYFMWAADDDLHEKTFVSSLLSCFLAGENIVFSGSFFDTINFVTGVIEQHDNIPLLAKENTRFENLCCLIQTPTPSFIYGMFLSSSLKQSRFIQLDAFDFGDVFLLNEFALLGKMRVVPQVLYHAGVSEAVRFPKSFSQFKLPGFKFGYSTYYFETVKLILKSDTLSRSKKIQSLQLINSQVFNIINYHEKNSLGVYGSFILSGFVKFVNSVLSKLQKRESRSL